MSTKPAFTESAARTGVWLAVAATVALVFIADLLTPLGVAAGVPYVLPIVFSLWLPGRRATVQIACAGTVFTLLGMVLSSGNGWAAAVLFNRAFAIIAIWVTCYVVLDRKRAEARRMRVAQARSDVLLAASVDPLVVIDRRGIIQDVSSSLVQAFGWTRDELLGQNINRLLPEPYQAEHGGYLDEQSHLEHSAVLATTREFRAVRRDGTEFPCDVSLACIDIPGQEEPLVAEIVRDTSVRKMHEQMMHDHIQRIEQLNSDLLQAKSALEETVQNLQKSNQELDEFAHVASHDLKEPLRGLHNYATIIVEDYAKQLDDDGRRMLERIMSLAHRMDDLIDTLLRFSRMSRAALTADQTDLNKVLSDVLERVEVRLREQAVEIRIPQPLPTASCDGALVVEVFANLISNAAKYNDNAKKWIEIGFQQLPDGNSAGFEGSTSDNGRIVYYVRDNGIGIAEKHVPSIFRMFKRLHGRDKYGGGSGVGLALVKRIVERHGGSIWLESSPGEGSTFFFTLGVRDDHIQSTERGVGAAAFG